MDELKKNEVTGLQKKTTVSLKYHGANSMKREH